MIAASAPGRSVGGDLEPRNAPLADKVADQHVGEQMGVDIAAAQHRRDLLALEALGIRQHRREAGGACPFNDGLFDPDEHGDGPLKVALGDQHDVVGIAP